jgi:hypothetical protein
MMLRSPRRPAMLVACVALASACGRKSGKKPPPEPAPRVLEGLAALPAGARVALGVDVAELRASPLVKRAVSQMLARDPALAGRIDDLVTRCRHDPGRDLDGFVVALGDGPSDVALVARGRFTETAIADCVRASMEAAGGTLTASQGAERAIYTARDAGGTAVWFAFGGPDTLVVAAGEEWLQAALGSGPKLRDDRALMGLVERAGTGSALWAAGRVQPEVGAGIVRVTSGKVANPPTAMFGHLDVTDGFAADLGVIMASAADAAEVVAFARPQLELLTVMAQEQGFGPVVGKIQVDADGATVHVRLALDAGEVAELSRQIDRIAGPEQDTARP